MYVLEIVTQLMCKPIQGRIQDFKKGGSLKECACGVRARSARAERAENLGVTTPTFAKPRPF